MTAVADASALAAEQLVVTRVAAPPARPRHVVRARLIEALAGGAGARLTLVTAPTGYGKTTLVAGACADLTTAGVRGVAWLALDPTANHLPVFTRYLIEAVRSAGPELRQVAGRVLQVPGSSPMAWLRSLVNDLAAAARPLTLVLDDYHVITDGECHAAVQFLLENSPSTLRLIISTRSEPPIPLGGLRASAQLVELRAADLRFTTAEASELLVQREGLDLSIDAVATLTTRTEGWAAGLYLAALWLRGHPGVETDPLSTPGTGPGSGAFLGDHRHVVDYMSEVILQPLGEEVRSFLLATSIVDRLCTPLCAALVGHPVDGMLEAIERSNLFLVPLDQTRTWYRYHHLFRETLQSELSHRLPGLVPELHRRASAWYRRNDMVPEAVAHAMAAGDADTAAALVCEHWLTMLRSGQDATVRQWLDAFPADARRRHPELGVVAALIVGTAGGTEIEFRRWLAVAEAGLADGRDDRAIAGVSSLRGGVDLLHAGFAYRDVRGAADAAAAAVQPESVAQEDNLRVAVLANVGFLRYLSGARRAARQALELALRDPRAPLRPYGYIVALTTRALIALDENRADDAERDAQRALAYAAQFGLPEHQVSGLTHVALGRAHRAARRPEAAAIELRRGLQLVRGGVTPIIEAYALLSYAPVAEAGHANAMADEAEKLLASYDDAGIVTAMLDQVRGRLGAARRRRRAPGSVEITAAELAVLRLLGGAGSQRSVAEALSISLNTVKSHTSTIYRKLGVTSREAAVVRARELHLI